MACCSHFTKAIFCLIHIREQWIEGYTKEYGTYVSAHPRSEHYREIRVLEEIIKTKESNK